MCVCVFFEFCCLLYCRFSCGLLLSVVVIMLLFCLLGVVDCLFLVCLYLALLLGFCWLVCLCWFVLLGLFCYVVLGVCIRCVWVCLQFPLGLVVCFGFNRCLVCCCLVWGCFYYLGLVAVGCDLVLRLFCFVWVCSDFLIYLLFVLIVLYIDAICFGFTIIYRVSLS